MTDTIISFEGKVKNSGLLGQKGLLLILSPENFGNSYIINKESLTVGRDQNCDVAVEDSWMSGSHFTIEVNDEGYFIEDLNSTNGTIHNSKALKKRTKLYYGDRITAGHTVFRFFLEESVSRK